MANLETLAKELNDAMLNERFRGPVDSEAVLGDFALAVDSFLTATSRAGLARDKQDGVLAAVHRLLAAERSSIRYTDRFIIACQVLWHCAKPETVTSGLYATSGAAALEYILYLSEPQVIASMVCDVAINGQWRSPSGNIVVVNRLNLLPVILPMVEIADDEDDCACEASLSTDISVHPRGVDRSYASHLAQLILTNEMLSAMPGHFRYVVNKLTAGMRTEIIEALYSNGRFVEQFAGISMSHVRRCAEMLLGRDVVVAISDEVKLFDLLYGVDSLPLLAAAATINGGVEWVAIKSFAASQGRLNTFNPKQSGQLASIGLKDFAQRLQ